MLPIYEPPHRQHLRLPFVTQLGGSLSLQTKMAASSKIGSTMLSRLATATPSTCLRATPSRAFSTSLVMRFGASSPTCNQSDDPASRRSNPLVGNFVRPQPPKPQQEPPVTTEHPKSSQPPKPAHDPTSSAEDLSNSDIPPPPPSLDASSEISIPQESGDAAEAYPYTAASSAAPLNLDIASIIANKAVGFGQSVSVDPQSRPNIRAKPVTGRTVFVGDRISSTSAPTPLIAVRVLNKMVAGQGVKGKMFQQRFHERKGLKRKRLRSLRWRARFKTGFKATVSRVLELKKQGW